MRRWPQRTAGSVGADDPHAKQELAHGLSDGHLEREVVEKHEGEVQCRLGAGELEGDLAPVHRALADGGGEDGEHSHQEREIDQGRADAASEHVLLARWRSGGRLRRLRFRCRISVHCLPLPEAGSSVLHVAGILPVARSGLKDSAQWRWRRLAQRHSTSLARSSARRRRRSLELAGAWVDLGPSSERSAQEPRRTRRTFAAQFPQDSWRSVPRHPAAWRPRSRRE